MRYLDEIIRCKIVAIIRGVEKDKMVPLVDALLNGGISCLEVAFNHASEKGIDETLESISLLNREFHSQLLMGAGTVLNTNQVVQASSAGAKFIISPNVSSEVIKKTKEIGALSMPGAMTPTEIVNAYNLGADIVKTFPAGIFGVKYLNALRDPLPHIPMMSVGGINASNINEFLRAGACAVGVGGNLINKKHINENNFKEITIEALRYTESLKDLK